MATFTGYSADNSSAYDLINQILSNDFYTFDFDITNAVFIGNESAVSTFEAIEFGDNSINSGILLTSGNGLPPQENTSTGFSTSNGADGDAALTEVVTSVFPNTSSNDAAILEFTFNSPLVGEDDGDIRSLAVDIWFGSDEYPEYIDSYVDIAAITNNGENYALFSNGLPLTLISENTEYGNITENTDLPIEYDGMTDMLTVYIPLQEGDNNIRFGIADTGDSSLDSGIFIGNTRVVDSASEGVKLDVTGEGDIASENLELDLGEVFNGSDGNDQISSGAGDDVVSSSGGDDTIYDGAGNDFYNGGDGNDTVVYDGGMSDFQVNENGESVEVSSENEIDTLVNIETIQFDDGNYEISPDIYGPEDDLFIVQHSGIVSRGEGDDTYVLSQATLDENSTIQLLDSIGNNSIQIIEGFSASATSVASSAIQFVNENGGVVTILNAQNFEFMVGGDPLTAQEGESYDFNDFVEVYLEASIPESGLADAGAFIA